MQGAIVERLQSFRNRVAIRDQEAPPSFPPAVQAYSIEAAAQAQTEGLLVYDNFAVYALSGNADDERVQEYVQMAKGPGRGKKQPLALTVPFTEDVLRTVSLDGIEHSGLRGLLRDGEELTRRIGALSFIRARADMGIKSIEGWPHSVIPEPDEEEPRPNVQIYSPEGLDMTTRVVLAAKRLGAIPVMTSVNVSKQPESITEVAARTFINESRPNPIDLPLFVNQSDEDKPARPRGSYPALKVLPDRLQLFRPGWLEPSLMYDLFPDVPVELASGGDLVKVNYPYNVLRRQDLPKDEQNLKGPELRLAILDKLV
jgi:hypothetical protein